MKAKCNGMEFSTAQCSELSKFGWLAFFVYNTKQTDKKRISFDLRVFPVSADKLHYLARICP